MKKLSAKLETNIKGYNPLYACGVKMIDISEPMIHMFRRVMRRVIIQMNTYHYSYGLLIFQVIVYHLSAPKAIKSS